MAGGTIGNLQGFLQQVHGLVRPSQPPKTRVESETSRYAGHLQKVRGLAKSTIDAHAYYARGLLEFIGYDKKALRYQYTMERWTLLHWDAFVHRHPPGSGQTVERQTFGCWARASARLAPRVQRSRLRIVARCVNLSGDVSRDLPSRYGRVLRVGRAAR
jgi:hypothetical protein